MPPTNIKLFGLNGQLDTLGADFLRELAEIDAESIGWLPLEAGAYLHVEEEQATEVLIVGIPQAGDAVLLVG